MTHDEAYAEAARLICRTKRAVRAAKIDIVVQGDPHRSGVYRRMLRALRRQRVCRAWYR